MESGDDGKGLCAARASDLCKGVPEVRSGSRNDWIPEETWSALRAHGRLRSIFFREVRRRLSLLLKCVLARWRASKDVGAEAWKVPCDRLCRADDAPGRSIPLQMFAFRETSKEAACLIKRDLVAWITEQTKHIAGQLVSGRTAPLWQLVRRISGRKRMGPRLVGALKDEDGKVVSTPEAAAAMWERKFLEGFSGLGELRDVVARRDESQDERVAAPIENEAKSVISEVDWLSLLSDALATTKQGKAVGPDALPGEFLRAGGMLLPHLAGLAARAMTVGVPKSWLGGRMAPHPEEGDAPLYFAEQPRHYVRQSGGGQGCGLG